MIFITKNNLDKKFVCNRCAHAIICEGVFNGINKCFLECEIGMALSGGEISEISTCSKLFESKEVKKSPNKK